MLTLFLFIGSLITTSNNLFLMRIFINKQFYFIALLLTCFMTACSPTAENELQKWQVNTETITTLTTNFPSFASVLKTDFEEMKSKWAEAEKMTDEEKKAEEMSKINDFFYSGYVMDLFSMNSDLERIEKKKEKIYDLKMTETNQEKAKDGLAKSAEKVAKAKEILSQEISDKATAEKVAKEADIEMAAAIAALDKIIKDNKKKKKKKRK